MGTPDNFDYAVDDVKWAIRHLRNHILELNNDESADAIACFLAINDLIQINDFLSPDGSDWPKAKDGMGQVIPFIPKQRA